MTISTNPNFWQQFEAAVSNGTHALLAQLQALGAKLKPLVEATAEELATVALNAVMAEVPKVLSGQEKLNSATANIVNGLAAQGKTIGAAAAQAAAQTSYNFLSAALNKPPVM